MTNIISKDRNFEQLDYLPHQTENYYDEQEFYCHISQAADPSFQIREDDFQETIKSNRFGGFTISKTIDKEVVTDRGGVITIEQEQTTSKEVFGQHGLRTMYGTTSEQTSTLYNDASDLDFP
jgi:hypothetical protein